MLGISEIRWRKNPYPACFDLLILFVHLHLPLFCFCPCFELSNGRWFWWLGMLIYLVGISHIHFSLLWYAFLMYSPGLHLIWWKLVFLEMMRLFTVKEACFYSCMYVYNACICTNIWYWWASLRLPSDSRAECIFIYTSMQHCLMDDWIIIEREQRESLNLSLAVPSPASFLR